MHPGAWLAWASGAAWAAVVTTNPYYLVPLAASAWFVHAVHRRPGPGGRAFRTFAVFGAVGFVLRTLLVLLAPGGAGTSSLLYAATEGLRMATVLVIFGTFNSVIDPSRVLRLAPRRWHEPALVAALALTLAPRTLASAARVREAQRMRGIDTSALRRLPALAVPVLAGGMDQALMLAESMDARGHGRGARSRYRPDRWDHPSSIVALGGLVAGTILMSLSLGGDPTIAAGSVPWRASWSGVLGAVAPSIAALARPDGHE